MIFAIVVLGLPPLIGWQEHPVGEGELERQPLSLPLDGARNATGEGLAFVEASAAKPAFFVEEPIRLTLRFGIEEEFLETRMVQPFGRPLDVPVQVSVPWIGELAGTFPLGVVEVAPDPGQAVRPTFALNESVQHAARAEDRVEGGRRFRVFEVEAAFLPTSEGELRFPAPLVAFAYATKFEEDLVRGRAPVDRVDAFASGEPLALAIRPLPLEGRPSEFTGAVGRLSVLAAVDPREIEMGESLKLSLTIQGEGNLGRFEAPSWSEIGGFRVLGTVDEKSSAKRTIVYDLAPVSQRVWQVPSVSFAYFNPGPPAEYRIARTEPIDVVVRKREAEDPAPTIANDARAAEIRPGASIRAFPTFLLGAGCLALVAALGIGLALRLRRRP